MIGFAGGTEMTGADGAGGGSVTVGGASATVVAYLSLNAVTHPETLEMPITHLFSFPTEGTVRAAALVVTTCAVAVARAQRITLSRAGRV